MAAPTNISAGTATTLVPPQTVTQDVNDGGTTYSVWYKYTAGAGQTGIGLFAYGDNVDYFVRARVYTGPAATPVAYLGFNATPLTFDTPFQVPFNTAGETYYIEFFSANGNVAAAPLTLTVAAAPALAAALGDIYINDENEDYPLAILDPTTAAVKMFVPDFANGENGAFLRDGTICLEDRWDDTAIIYRGATEVVVVPFPHAPASAYISVSGNRVGKFYLGNRGAGATTAFVRRMSTTGVLEATIWTLAASGLQAMAPALDDSILYWATGTAADPIRRHDLATDLPLSDLAAGIANYRPSAEMFVLADGTILVGYLRTATTNPAFMVKRYSTAGALLNTFNYNTLTTTTHRLALGADDPASFWLKIHTSSGGVQFINTRISDGVAVTTLNSFEYSKGKSNHTYALTQTTHFGNAASCPFWITADATPPGPPVPTPTAVCPPVSWLLPATPGCVAIGELPDNSA